MDWISFLTETGSASIDYLWIPLGFWTVAAIPIFLISRVLGVQQPGIHYQGCMALLLSLPLGFLMMPLMSLGIQTGGMASGLSTLFDTFVDIMPANSSSSLDVDDLATTQLSDLPPSEKINGLAIVGAITLTSLLVSVFSCFKLLREIKGLKLLTERLKPIQSREVGAEIRDLIDRLGIKRQVKFLLSPLNSAPFTYGWKRPVVVIPEGIDSEMAILRAILSHELIHVRRNDYFFGLTARILAAIFVFHPFVFFLSRQIKMYREFSCDREMIGWKSIEPSDYARLLLRFSTSISFPSSISMIRQSSNLKKRVEFMAHYRNRAPKTNRLARTLLLPVALLLPVLIMSCSLQQAEVDQRSQMPQNSIVLEDLGVSLNLPDGWVEHSEPLRKTLADRLSLLSEEELATVDVDTPEKLEHGVNLYTYNNLDQYGSIPDEELFAYFLHIEMHNYFSEDRRALWKRGLCKPGQPCADRMNQNLHLVRELSREENPFGNGTGFMYEVKVGDDESLARRMYMYYVVLDERCYRVMFDGLARDLDENTYPDILNDIDFAS